jgi:hypothetical protein
MRCLLKQERWVEGNWGFVRVDPSKEESMAIAEFKQVLAVTDEIEITVTGRKSGRKISGPVWFVLEGETLYLLPVKGSESDWYKNILRTPIMTISARGIEITVNVKPITDPERVGEVVEKFRAKYGPVNIQRYYSKFDVAVEARLQ